MFCFICTFSSWITVYKCYYQFKESSGYDQHSAGGYGNSSDGQLTQPLLSSSGELKFRKKCNLVGQCTVCLIV